MPLQRGRISHFLLLPPGRHELPIFLQCFLPVSMLGSYLTVHACSNSARPECLAGHVRCVSPHAGPLALGLPCCLAQWQAAHKTDRWIKDSACGYTQQDPRSVTSVLNNLLLVLQRKWGVHYWVIKTHFIRKIYTIYIFDIGFQRVTQSYRRACKKGSNSTTWETTRSLHTDRQLLLNCEGVMDGNEKIRSEKDRKGCNSSLTLAIFTYNFTLCFVLFSQYGNWVDHLLLKFQLYVDFSVMRSPLVTVLE